jgi:hypothetical protein
MTGKKRTAAVKAKDAEAALEEVRTQADDVPKILRTESVSPEGIQIGTFSPEPGTYFEGEPPEQTAAVDKILATVPETPALATEPVAVTEPAKLTVETPVPSRRKG